MNKTSDNNKQKPVIQKSINWMSGLILLLFVGFVIYARQSQLTELSQRVVTAFFNAFYTVLEFLFWFNILQVFLFNYVTPKLMKDDELPDWMQDLATKSYHFHDYDNIDFILFIVVTLLATFVFPPLFVEGIFVIISSVLINRAKYRFNLTIQTKFISSEIKKWEETDE